MQMKVTLESPLRPPIRHFYPRKAYIVEPGYTLTDSLYIERGAVGVGYHTEEGRIFMPVILGSGDILLEGEFPDGPIAKFAQALKDSLVPPVNGYFSEVRTLRKRVAHLEQALFLNGYANTTSRLCAKLLELSNKFGKEKNGCVKIDLYLPHYIMGYMIGSSRETVNAKLIKLRDEGIIHYNSGEITLMDMEILKQIARIK